MKLARHLHFTTIAAILVTLAVVTCGVVLAYPWNGLSLLDKWSEMRTGTIYYHGSDAAPEVALTFDDGPDPRYTPHVLDVLKRQHVHATFFLIGGMLAKHPELGRRIADEGNVIGNHTQTHPHLEAEGSAAVCRELDQCEQDIGRATG